MLKKIRRLFFDYEEFGPQTGHTMKMEVRRYGDYYFTVKTSDGKFHPLYRYYSRKEVHQYEIFSTVSKSIAHSIMEDYRYASEHPIYTFYRVKNKYCVVNKRYTDDSDVWLSGMTKLGGALLLLLAFLSGSAIIFIIYQIIKAIFNFIF